MSIGIVIPAYRSAETLGRTIRSCLPHVEARDIVVVLDGPDDEAEKAARQASGDLRILIMPRNCGAPVCQ